MLRKFVIDDEQKVIIDRRDCVLVFRGLEMLPMLLWDMPAATIWALWTSWPNHGALGSAESPSFVVDKAGS